MSPECETIPLEIPRDEYVLGEDSAIGGQQIVQLKWALWQVSPLPQPDARNRFLGRRNVHRVPAILPVTGAAAFVAVALVPRLLRARQRCVRVLFAYIHPRLLHARRNARVFMFFLCG